MSETIDKQKLLKEINERRKADFIALSPDNIRNQIRCEMWSEFNDMVQAFESSSDHLREENERFRQALNKIRKYYGEEGYYGFSVANEALSSTNISVTELSVDRVNDNPIAQAIREFMPTGEQRAGYDALVAWLESTTSFISEPSEDNARREGGNEG